MARWWWLGCAGCMGTPFDGVPPPVDTRTATYTVEVLVDWTAERPCGLPEQGHLSWFAGATHPPGAPFWEPGTLAGPGMVDMAEHGNTALLLSELADRPDVDATIDWPWWLCPADIDDPACGDVDTGWLDVERGAAALSAVTMLGPSPDWFVGASDLLLRDAVGWLPVVEVPLVPWDGGTRDGDALVMGGPPTTPPEPIQAITAASGQVIGPEPLGVLRLTLRQ